MGSSIKKEKEYPMATLSSMIKMMKFSRASWVDSIKKVIYVLAMGGFLERVVELNRYPINKVKKPLKRINLTIVDTILLYSEMLIKEWKLEKYRNKILIAPRHFLDFN